MARTILQAGQISEEQSGPGNTSAKTHAPFTRWIRALDGPELCLVLDSDCGIAEWIDVDLRDLPRRPDLIARLGAAASLRLLGEASAYDSQPALQLGGTP